VEIKEKEETDHGKKLITTTDLKKVKV